MRSWLFGKEQRKTPVCAGVLLLSVLFLVAGCAKKPHQEPEVLPPPVTTVEPDNETDEERDSAFVFEHVHTSDLEGEIWSVNPRQSLSPDGAYVLLTQESAEGTALLVVATTESALEPLVLHSVERTWVSRYQFGYYPLGWTSDSTCLFAIQGTMNSGPSVGKTGVAIYEANIKEAGEQIAEESAFIALQGGVSVCGHYFPESGRVLLGVPGAVWEYDIATPDVRCIATMPNDGTHPSFFYPRPSADGLRLAYDLWGVEPGIYVMDVESARHKRVVSPSVTTSFYPAWSPDKRYFAAYTVGLRDGEVYEEGKTNIAQYDIVLSDEGAMPMGTAITVYTPDGSVVRTIEVEGMWLSTFEWSPDGRYLGFVAGEVVSQSLNPEFSPKSVWVCAVDGGCYEVDTILPQEGPGQIYSALVSVDADGLGLVYVDYRADTAMVRHGRLEGRTPLPGFVEGDLTGWSVESDGNPEHPVVGVVQSGEASSVWAFSADGWDEVARFMSDGRNVSILGYKDGVLVVADSPLINYHSALSGDTTESASFSTYELQDPAKEDS